MTDKPEKPRNKWPRGTFSSNIFRAAHWVSMVVQNKFAKVIDNHWTIINDHN